MKRTFTTCLLANFHVITETTSSGSISAAPYWAQLRLHVFILISCCECMPITTSIFSFPFLHPQFRCSPGNPRILQGRCDIVMCLLPNPRFGTSAFIFCLLYSKAFSQNHITTRLQSTVSKVSPVHPHQFRIFQRNWATSHYLLSFIG